MEGADPVGTLECPDGWVLDDNNLCRPASALDIAGDIGDNFVRPEDMPAHLRPKKPKKKLNATDLLREIKALESAAPFKPTDKMERCITDVKSRLRKSNKTFQNQSIKSAAIAICRSRLKQ